jgi:hypothetical protein
MPHPHVYHYCPVSASMSRHLSLSSPDRLVGWPPHTTRIWPPTRDSDDASVSRSSSCAFIRIIPCSFRSLVATKRLAWKESNAVAVVSICTLLVIPQYPLVPSAITAAFQYLVAAQHALTASSPSRIQAPVQHPDAGASSVHIEHSHSFMSIDSFPISPPRPLAFGRLPIQTRPAPTRSFIPLLFSIPQLYHHHRHPTLVTAYPYILVYHSVNIPHFSTSPASVHSPLRCSSFPSHSYITPLRTLISVWGKSQVSYVYCNRGLEGRKGGFGDSNFCGSLSLLIGLQFTSCC